MTRRLRRAEGARLQPEVALPRLVEVKARQVCSRGPGLSARAWKRKHAAVNVPLMPLPLR
jgi:hypothetical protein